MKNQGIEVNDMGSKLGLNGIDNGYIKFTNVEVPVDNLLNRYGGFKENGEYHSDIKNKEVRFGKMLSALSMGRISIAIGAYAIAYKAFIIALKYNLKRRQFQFRGEKDEKLIIEYQTQLERFAIIYSTLYHLRLGILDLVETYKKEGFSKNVHAISSLLKVYSSWNAVKITALCREMCGGHGYLWKNQIGLLMNDVNIYQTFEGDNTVLIQQGTKWIIDEFRSKNYLNFVKLLNNCGTMKKIENRLYLNIANLIFKLMDKKNIEKRWLSNLRQIVDIGVEYTELYLLSLNPNKSSIIFDAYANYVIDKESSSAMLKLMLERNILSDVVKDWDISYRKLTDYIPITKYPEYFKSSL
jgi:hypothetical protein